MSFRRACLARVRNPETSVWMGKKIEILRAAATRENDKSGIVQDQNRHYDMQDSIVITLTTAKGLAVAPAEE